jgi:2-aminoadipate transaminase
LRFKGKTIPTLKSIDTEGIVVYCASLSKIISPGIRLGTIIANKEIIDKFNILKGASAGAVTNWSQHVIARFLETVDMDKHLAHLQSVYGKKSTFMVEMMKKTFHPDVKFTTPEGGMFVWFELPKYADARTFLNRATTMHIAIVNEETFAVNRRDKMNGFRLSFTSATMEQIETGIAKLGKLTYELCK